jgi:hypothetical protein
MLWLRDHPYPSSVIDYWMGISLLSPSHRLSEVLKAPERAEISSLGSRLPPGPTMFFFVFPFPNF